MRMTSPDLTRANIDKIVELFPNVVTESIDADGNPTRAVDFDLLRQELSDHIVEGPQERYRLDWPGKRAAAFAANAPIAKTLRPVRGESVEFDTTQNLFIEGDNLDALKLLQESYLGKVKLIYIDPPYNTGNDFIYNDDFSETTADYLARSGQTDHDGGRLVANTDTNGRYHSDWLSMMYPRLKLARNLLRDDGAIFMSINDSELENLKHVASEVFGGQNFVGTMVWAAGRKNDSRFISASHEYLVCFSRDLSVLRERGITWKIRKKGLASIYRAAEEFVAEANGDYEVASRKLRAWFRGLPDNDEAKRSKHYCRIDERGVFFADNISWPGGGGPKYEVLHPSTGRPVAVPSRGWLFQPDVMRTHIAEGRVHFGADETVVPTFKRYLRDTELEVAYSVFYQDGRAASKRLRELMGAAVFDFPKDERVLQTIVEMTTSGDDIVLDFFAGSATTAHAVLAANSVDGGTRRFVMVQLDEAVSPGSTADENGYRLVSEISRERIRRAGAQAQGAAVSSEASIDVGFRALSVDSTNLTAVMKTADATEQLHLDNLAPSIKPDRSSEDLLFQVLLGWGLELTLPITKETIDGFEVYDVEEGALILCTRPREARSLSLSLSRAAAAIAERQPLRAVFLDEDFADDAERINVGQVFCERSPHTEVKTI
ncbi:site-specific DNA-methyltransferase [Brevibacterium luteolum]|uniref:site-specific DNA-methyltransferase n=1 Tax=Brevibacterium luteolum TaxID=199591 RepID=UPI003EEBDEBE